MLGARGAGDGVGVPYGCVGELVSGATGASGNGVVPVGGGSVMAPGVVGRRLLGWVGELQGASPVALVVDSAEGVDAASLQALASMMRRLGRGRVLVVLGVRWPPSWDGPTRMAVEGVEPVVRVGLSGLSVGEVGELVRLAGGDGAGTEVVRRLHRYTGGHPSYVANLLALGWREALDVVSGEGAVPSRVAEVVSRQIVGLPVDSGQVLEALAVLGDAVPVAVLSRVLGYRDCTAALDAPVQAGLVEWSVEGDLPAVGFRHPVQREAVYGAMSPTRRRELHRAAGAAVSRRGALVHKVASAQAPDPALAGELETFAGLELREGRLDSAARYLWWASGLVAAEEEDRSDRLLFGAIRLWFWAGADGEVSRRGQAVCARRPSVLRDEALGLLEFAAGRLIAARTLLRRASRTVATAERDPQAAVLFAELATVCAVLGEGEEVERAATAALAALGFREDGREEDGHDDAPHDATGPDTPDPTAPGGPPEAIERTAADGDGVRTPHAGTVVPGGVASSARAFAAYGRALREGALPGLESFDYLPERPDRVRDDDLLGLALRGVLRLASGRFAEAEADLTAATARVRPGGVRLLGMSSRMYLGICHFLTGYWDQAARDVDRGLAMVATHGRVFDRAMLFSLSAMIEAARGDQSAAARSVGLATEASRDLDYAGPQFHIALARAVTARARGDFRGVLAALQNVAQQAAYIERARLFAACWLPIRIEALIECGRLEQARQAIAALAPESDPDNALLAVADIWLRGRLAEASGDPKAAEEVYATAADALRPEQDMPLFRGLLEQAYGRCVAAQGRVADAQRHLQAAEATFTALGAIPFQVACRADLAALGTREGLGELEALLTPREREVAGLVGLGHTNREIAQELLLSVKTIEYHLRSIFSKLGVRNRRELRNRVQDRSL
ncbi:LuxR C-terminal-related transcriptional regulator [Streptomyces sp. NPDC048636]|uniref:helix-turn-helix transcriptional regulator n=1 Tax=Streptomyces sp. NPDC048636 TaxID=3155762 RepID=UPI0034178729